MADMNHGREETPVPSVQHVGTLGTLTLIKRKGGADVQSFPLDAERITFGRDYECDVRVYYSDVSKLHCEINFDMMSGQASLQVHGQNGVLHTPAGGSATMHKPPTTVALADRDIITIRKKPFRFEYGTNEIANPGYCSPAVHNSPLPALSASPIKPHSPGSRRRASHRLSLVPAGKTFVPMSPAKHRRHSTLGLGGMTAATWTPAGKSKLHEVVQQDTIDEDDGTQTVVDVADGDEGDVVYLEATEETRDEEPSVISQKPIHNSPFMTPQQAGKAPLRNTSAVPRTRKLNLAHSSHETSGAQIEESEEPVQQLAEVRLSDSPVTPRSIPLPAVTDTPYEPPTTPSIRLPSTPVPAHVALSTPKGPATLRKALLLRSARKVWEESRASGIDGAIQKGDVETRRKSTSPRRKSGRKSTTPFPQAPPVQHQQDETEQEEVVQLSVEPQWINEDGSVEKSFESDSSGFDSLEADMSLDVAGQGIVELHDSHLTLEHEEISINDQGRLDQADHYEREDDDSVKDQEMEEYASEEEIEEIEEVEGEEVEVASLKYEENSSSLVANDMEDEEGDMATSLPNTPQIRQSLGTNFFTPQPVRNIAKQPRRSLATIGGPAVRFDRLPATPGSRRGAVAPPGSMGRPSRRVTNENTRDEAKVEVEEMEETDVKVFATPRKSETTAAEFKRHHEALATPRPLPAPPMSGFRDPVRDTRFSDLVPTPTHRALAPTSPESEDEEKEETSKPSAVPATPMDDLKKRLNSIRRQSVQRQDPYNRRATVGFVLPQTPSNRSALHHPYSVASQRQLAAQAPRTPIFPPLKRETPIFPKLDRTPIPVSPVRASPVQAQMPSSPEFEQPSSPSTPSYTGVREMLKPTNGTKTPHMGGIRDLFPSTPKETASPSLTGLREMLAQPSVVSATPSLTGMRTLFGETKVPPTPAMEGLREMYEEDAEEELGIDEALNTSMEEENIPEPAAKKQASRSKLPQLVASTLGASRTKRAAPATASHSTEKEIVVSAPVKTATKIPARRGKAAASETVQRPNAEVEEPKSKAARARKMALDASSQAAIESTSRTVRSKRTASADRESAPAPSQSTRSGSRSTRSKASAEPEESELVDADIADTKPSRSRSTSSRAKRSDSEVPVAVDEDASKSSRSSKRVLVQIEEQPASESKNFEKRSISAPIRGKKATSATAGTSTMKKAESVSAPTRRKAKADDEVEVENKENQEKVVPKKRAAPTKKEKDSGLPVPVAATTRSTRSRK